MFTTVPRDSVTLSGGEWSLCFAVATSGSSKIGSPLRGQVPKSTKRSFLHACVATS
jgi:hypothetical protein